MKVFVSTHPFSSTSELPMKMLQEQGITVKLNEHGRKITPDELAADIGEADVLIAGTEDITESVFKNAPNVKLISRVGIGLDGVDFELCRKYGVRVAYTPDAPTLAVAELCVGHILGLARMIHEADINIRNNVWKRHMGMLLYGKTIGIIGLGRIGKSLANIMRSFNVKIIAHDIKQDTVFARLNNIRYVSFKELLQESDVVSVNVPLDKSTRCMISLKELSSMKSGAILVNTARGGIIDENDLYKALKDGMIAGAGIDVFETEPYKGKFSELSNCLLTCHMGASTKESRTDMEVQAVEAAIAFFRGEPIENEVELDV